MSKKQIKPVSFWTFDGNKQANEIMLYNFHQYDFDGTDSVVSYKLGYTNSMVDPNGESQEYWVSLNEGSVKLPDSLVQSWGSDDDLIFDYVVGELNLEYDNS
jgi:hypothetical protein